MNNAACNLYVDVRLSGKGLATAITTRFDGELVFDGISVHKVGLSWADLFVEDNSDYSPVGLKDPIYHFLHSSHRIEISSYLSTSSSLFVSRMKELISFLRTMPAKVAATGDYDELDDEEWVSR